MMPDLYMHDKNAPEQTTRKVFIRMTDEEGAVLAYFQVTDPILSAEGIAAYLEDEAHDRFDAEAL
jgi:hypothetical protein